MVPNTQGLLYDPQRSDLTQITGSADSVIINVSLTENMVASGDRKYRGCVCQRLLANFYDCLNLRGIVTLLGGRKLKMLHTDTLSTELNNINSFRTGFLNPSCRR